MESHGSSARMEASSAVAIKEFLSETVSRIRLKKTAQEREKLKEAEEQRAQDQAFRVKWKESVKQKRNREIVEKVDEALYDSIIRVNSDLWSSSKSALLRKRRTLRKCKINSEYDECRNVDDNLPIVSFLRKKMENQQNLDNLIGDLIISEHVVDRTRDSGEYKISFTNKHSNKQASFEFTSGGDIPASLKYLQRIGSYGLQVQHKLDEPWQRIEEKALLFNHYNSNKLQLIDLVSDLLNLQSLKKDDILNSQRLPSGMMLKIMENAQHSWFRPVRTERSPSVHTGNIPISLLKQLSTEERQVDSSVHDVKKSKKDSNKQKNMFLAPLIERICIIGADDQKIMSFLQESSEKDLKGKSFERLKSGRLPPEILFDTDNAEETSDHPIEMTMQLPGYCYPRSVDIQIRLAPNLDNSNVRRSLNQGSREPPKTMPAVIETGSKKKSKFFNNEYNIFSSDKVDEIPINNDLDKSYSSKTGIGLGVGAAVPNFVRSETKNELGMRLQPFILQMGDHTYQNYCVAQTFGVSFLDTISKAVIHTTYTICVLTKFPFFSYFSYIISQWEKDTKFMNFESPLPKFDVQFPLNAQLRFVHDLYHRLHKVKAQLFPYFSSKSHNKNKVEAATSADIDGSDCVGILQDINPRISLKNQDRKLIEFKRSLYQAYYSSHARNFDEISDALLTNIKFQEKLEKMDIGFIPTSLHKSERDREETFLILQWTLPTLLKYLPLDQVVLCLGCVMVEMKIIVKHKDINVISSIILALQRLVRPLKWCSPVIITVTEDMMDLIESPVPIMLGMQSLPDRFELLEGYVVVDPEVKTVHLHPTDIVQSHTTLLPNASMLYKALTPHANTILELWRKRRSQRQKVTITVHSDLVDGSDTSRPDSATPQNSPNPAEVIPLELDITDPSCMQFSGAVQRFSSLVSNHILAILNTGIQLQQKEKQEAREKRRVVAKQSKPEFKRVEGLSPTRIGTDGDKSRSPIQNTTNMSSPGSLQTGLHANPRDHYDIDDGVSDLTATDIPTLRGSNELESVKGDSSGGASVTSSTSSLPSLRSDAPVLREQSLGQSGVKFVRKVIDTQMYSNYCQSLKVDNDGFLVMDGSFYNPDLSSLQQKDSTQSGSGMETGSYRPIIEEKSEDFDSLLGVFEIMTSGTIAMKADQYETLKKSYLSLYSNDMTREKLSRFAPPTSLMNKLIGLDKRRLIAYKEEVLMKIAEGKRVAISDIEKYQLKYCTGLFCQGDCNTELCSELCLSIWQKKVQSLRHKQAAYEIISAKYEKQSSSQSQLLHEDNIFSESSTVVSNTVSNISTLGGGGSRIEYITEDGVRLEPIRHGKETESQYQQRKEVVSQNIISKIRHKTSPIGNRKRRKPISALTFHPATMEKGDRIKTKQIKRRAYANSDCDDYTYALAKYYGKKESRLVQKHYKVNRAIIYRFVRRFVTYCRQVNREHAVIYCQAIARGYLLRKKIGEVLESLYFRKQLRFYAKIVIRNYIRSHRTQILRNFERWNRVRLMKRRTSLNVRGSLVLPEGTHVVDPNGQTLTSSAASNLIVSSKGTPTVAPIAPKFINEPSLQFTEDKMPPAPTNSMKVTGLSSFDVITKRGSLTGNMQNYMKIGVIFRGNQSGSSPANISSRLTTTPKLPLHKLGLSSIPEAPPIPVTSPKNSHPLEDKSVQLSPLSTTSNPNSTVEIAQLTTSPPASAFVPFPKSPTATSSKASSVGSTSQNSTPQGSPDTFLKLPLSSPPNNLTIPITIHDSSIPSTINSARSTTSSPDKHGEIDAHLVVTDKVDEAMKPAVGGSDKSRPNSAALSRQTSGTSAHTFSAIKKVSSQEQLPDRRSDNSDTESVSTTHKSVNHSQKYIPSSASVVSSTSVVTSSNASSSKGTDLTKKTKQTPIGRHLAANNYAVSTMVAHSGAVRAHSRSSYGSNPRSDAASVSSRSYTNTAPDDTCSTVDGESKSDRNTMLSSEKSDGDDERSLNGKGDTDDSPLKSHVPPTTSLAGTTTKVPFVDHAEHPTPIVAKFPVPPPPVSSGYPPRPTDSNKKPNDESNIDISSGNEAIMKVASQDDLNFDPDENYANGSGSTVDKVFEDYPMKTFGNAGKEHFTSQQISLVKSLYDLLREGVPVHKHGRKGKPGKKVLYCNNSMTKLYWRSSSSKKDKEDVDEESVPILGNNHGSSNSAIAPREQKQRRSSLFAGKDDSEREIWIGDIKEVTNECSSEVLQRAKANHYLGLEKNCAVLCMKTVNRSLDLEVEKSKWDRIFPALQVVVEFYNQEHVKDDIRHEVEADDTIPWSAAASESNYTIPTPTSHHSSSFAALFNNQPFPEEISTTATTSLGGIKAGIVEVADYNSSNLEYDTAGKRDKAKK